MLVCLGSLVGKGEECQSWNEGGALSVPVLSGGEVLEGGSLNGAGRGSRGKEGVVAVSRPVQGPVEMVGMGR